VNRHVVRASDRPQHERGEKGNTGGDPELFGVPTSWRKRLHHCRRQFRVAVASCFRACKLSLTLVIDATTAPTLK
jgi:hypothetical protein